MASIILVSDRDKDVDDYLNSFKTNSDLLIEITPKTKEYSISQIREIASDIKTYLPNRRIFLLKNFNNSSVEAQNAFLKTLEESSDKNVFLLCINDLNQLLPTVISRSKIINLVKKTKKAEKDLSFVKSFFSDKEMGFLSEKYFLVKTKEQALEIIDDFIQYCHKNLDKGNDFACNLSELIKTRELILNNNLVPQLAIDNLLIEIKSKLS